MGAIDVNIVISSKAFQARRVRFFQRGRRINFLNNIKSFMEYSQYKVRVFGAFLHTCTRVYPSDFRVLRVSDIAVEGLVISQ